MTKTDSAIGTGALAVAGKNVKVHYTGWLHSTKVAATRARPGIPANAGLVFDIELLEVL